MPADGFFPCFAVAESVKAIGSALHRQAARPQAQKKRTTLAHAGVKKIVAIFATTTEEIDMIRSIALAICCSFAIVSAVHAEERIRVNNNSGRDVCEFYISAHDENDWGDDLFENLDRCIHHGEYAQVTWPETANTDLLYDVRYVFRNGEEAVFENNVIKPDTLNVFNFNR